MKNDARGAANAFLRRYALSRPSLDDLVAVVTEMGFELIDFDPKDDTMVVLKERLNLTDSILSQEAFIYQNGDVRLLFVRDSLNGTEKLYAVAHELGHIVLGHTSTRPSVIEEHEANEFSHYILHPQVSLRAQTAIIRNKRLAGAAIVGMVVILIALGFYMKRANRKHYTDDFYITSSGTKYHRAACSVIKERTNARKMTQEEYESGNYEPCALCVPEE